jgi:hypothetical protein
MLSLWVVHDERRLWRAAGWLVLAGAGAALALAAGSRLRPGWETLASALAHLPGALAAAVGVAAVAGVGGWGRRALMAAGLAVAAVVGHGAWASVLPGALAAPAFLPAAATMSALGAVSGLVTLLGLLPAHLSCRPLRLWWAARGPGCAGPEAGELDALVGRGIDLWQRVERAPPDRPVKTALAGALARLFGVAQRWRQLDQAAALPAAAAIEDARTALARRSAGSADPVVRVHCAQAQDSLEAQRRQLAAIAISRDRMYAHLQRQLAAMEALFLASVTARSADAARTAETLRPLLDELARLGDALDAGRELTGDLEATP